MKKFSLMFAAAIAAVSLLLGGCVASIGNDTPPQARSTTLGQELIDLQKAKDSGAISEQEYQQQRAKILGYKKAE